MKTVFIYLLVFSASAFAEQKFEYNQYFPVDDHGTVHVQVTPNSEPVDEDGLLSLEVICKNGERFVRPVDPRQPLIPFVPICQLDHVNWSRESQTLNIVYGVSVPGERGESECKKGQSLTLHLKKLVAKCSGVGN